MKLKATYYISSHMDEEDRELHSVFQVITDEDDLDPMFRMPKERSRSRVVKNLTVSEAFTAIEQLSPGYGQYLIDAADHHFDKNWRKDTGSLTFLAECVRRIEGESALSAD